MTAKPLEQFLFGSIEEDKMKHPAYHLRTNKAVDRLLLVAILRILDPDCRDITYYSLGGPFLEDLRVMDHFFPEMKLVSLESNEQTFKRQNFNKFSSRIELRHTTLANFLLHDHNPESKEVFWLDYTDLKYERFEDFQIVLRQVIPGSVVRITLRAEPDVNLSALEEKFSSPEIERFRRELAEAFRKRFDKFLTEPVEDEIFTRPSKFPALVQRMVRRAAALALDSTGRELEYLPLQCTRYIDGTQMLSVTGIVCERTETANLRKKFGEIRFANQDWHEPDRIDVPALSLKERLHLEPLLPVASDKDAGEVLFKALSYMIDDGEKRTKQKLAHYAACQRDYPNFVRIAI